MTGRQNTTQETKYWATWTLQKNGGKAQVLRKGEQVLVPLNKKKE
jgi:hypothetical protein